jgi:hypothetical protein
MVGQASACQRPRFPCSTLQRRMRFELVGSISNAEVIAAGPGIRVRSHLRKVYGPGRWRKMKGIATVRLPNGALRRVELHWYEAHGIGKKDMKIKRYLDEA